MKNSKLKIKNGLAAFCLLHFAFLISAVAQEQPPKPSAPRAAAIPAIKEKKLANKLTIATVERKNVPLVTVQMMIRAGAGYEASDKAGLANLTASLLTKGTRTRSASQLAEQIEFLGGSINTVAGWNSSYVVMTVRADKLDQAMPIFADAMLNPSFAQSEIDLLKSQTLDELNYNLKQPAFLGTYAASRLTYGEHPAGGTVASINNVSRADIEAFYKSWYAPDTSFLIFTGDIPQARAFSLGQRFFNNWKNPPRNFKLGVADRELPSRREEPIAKRIIVVDLPNSGQASVSFNSKIKGFEGRNNKDFFAATVGNSVLGGGYSSRLNQEIRIKRGLSYGAGSSYALRWNGNNFSTRTQTKNESAAEVAELVLGEIERLGKGDLAEAELTPRKSVLTGTFSNTLETTGGLAGAVADIYLYNLDINSMNAYINSVNAVTEAQARRFAADNLRSGDVVIVGDAKVFMDDLRKRFPKMEITTIKADDLDKSMQ